MFVIKIYRFFKIQYTHHYYPIREAKNTQWREVCPALLIVVIRNFETYIRNTRDIYSTRAPTYVA